MKSYRKFTTTEKRLMLYLRYGSLKPEEMRPVRTITEISKLLKCSSPTVRYTLDKFESKNFEVNKAVVDGRTQYGIARRKIPDELKSHLLDVNTLK